MNKDSDKKTEAKPQSDNRTEKKVFDPELDVKSDKFNPLKALTSSDFVLPVEKAKIFDNVAVFESYWKRTLSGESKQPAKCKCNKSIFF